MFLFRSGIDDLAPHISPQHLPVRNFTVGRDEFSGEPGRNQSLPLRNAGACNPRLSVAHFGIHPYGCRQSEFD